MRYSIIFFCSICCIFANAQIVKSESSEFVLTCDCGKEKKFDLCLIGKFPPSKQVNLLSQKNSKTCKAKTFKTFDYKEYPYDGGEALQMTPIYANACKQPKQYTLAYLGNDVFEYQLTSMGKEASSSTIDKVDKIIRKSNFLKESEEIPFSNFLLKKPILYIPVAKYSNTYIVQYIIGEYPRPVKYGPLFFYGNNRAMKIDSEAEIIKTFKLNGRYFVLIKHACWVGCGNVYTTLLEIKNSEYKKIFEDGTWAD